jgi:hypothetical protein
MKPLIVLLILCAAMHLSRAADSNLPINSDLLKKGWPASWIAHPTASPNDYGVFHFRKSFDLGEKPASFVVHLSADNRYRFFVNGTSVCLGPARGDLFHWRFETVDLAPYLKPGKNVVAAVVWNFGVEKPWAQMSLRTGLIVQGDSAREQVVNTDGTWKVLQDVAYSPEGVAPRSINQFMVVGPGERIDGNGYPWGWQDSDFDDARWLQPQAIVKGLPYGVGTDVSWWLEPRSIPLMEETPQRIATVRRAQGVVVDPGFLLGHAPITIPAHTKAVILFDQSFQTNAYPQLRVSGGKGGTIRLIYSEALFDQSGAKGNRNDIAGREAIGESDVFVPDGGPDRRFTTLWFRTYRYIEMTIETAAEPLTVSDFYGNFTGYPFKERGSFACNDARLADIWTVGWRTARLCAYETYFDCPYYEQMQYVGDTRIQGLVSLYVAGDDRLMRNAISLYDLSRIPEGLTQSRFPSSKPQIITTFSLFWIDMVHDYWMHRDDPAFIEAKLMGIQTVLDWFEHRLDPQTGMLGALPYWSFVDWPDQWPWDNNKLLGGQPDGAAEGGSSIVSLQLAGSLDHAAELFDAFGKKPVADHYRELARNLKAATLRNCWDESRQLLADTPARKAFSQHANVLAVLSGGVQGEKASALVARLNSEPGLTQCTQYFRFYLLRAMKTVGLGDQYVSMLQPWHDMLARGLTTFAERPDPTRSDCHAWSASPLYEFLATVCGVEPASPGFRTVRIEPHLGYLTHVQGTVPHPAGDIKVAFTRMGKGIEGEVTLPPGLSGNFLWQGRGLPLHPGRQPIRLNDEKSARAAR